MASLQLFASATYGVGPHGPIAASCPAGISSVLLTVDRTAGASSLNSLPASARATLLLEEEVLASDGTTKFWTQLAQVAFQGGLYIDPDTQVAATQTQLSFGGPMVSTLSGRGQLSYPAAGQILLGSATGNLRATLTVSGQTISAAASLTLS